MCPRLFTNLKDFIQIVIAFHRGERYTDYECKSIRYRTQVQEYHSII